MAFSRSPRLQVKSGSDGHGNLVKSMDSEPLKTFQPKLTQILHAVRRRTDYVYKVMDSKVKVTDDIFSKMHFSGEGVPS